MNITELARILKITPQELLDTLPKMGFDIGRRAIKIDSGVAQRIIKEWTLMKKRLNHDQQMKKYEQANNEDGEKKEKKIVKLPSHITVRDFAALTGQPINAVLSELMKNSIFVSLNERIDFETAWLIGSDLNLDIQPLENNEENPSDIKSSEKLKGILDKENADDMQSRPPVIVVMGHVDHGKTKLLDAIRRTDVVAGEAGGITQHIGAYQVTRRNRLITFIDTPGHEAFTAMRSRGAKIADVAILVVAADDGVKPQTIEAYRIIEAAKVPFVVAINKIDKPEANIDKTKQELSNQLGIIPEDWGGKVPCLPVSARDGQGIVEILDTILLISDMEAQNIKANPAAEAVGTIVESHVDKGSGPVATILIQNGTLRVGDQLCLENIALGRVRALKDYKGESVVEAVPSMPVEIMGLKGLPEVGDIIEVGSGEKIKFRKNKSFSPPSAQNSSGNGKEEDEGAKKICLIIKSDVLGSAEAIEESLMKINSSKAVVKILHKGLGNITDGDIKRAEATGAAVIGFNVKVPTNIMEMSREKNVTIKLYRIIYDLINDVKKQINELIEPDIKRVELGKLQVLALFRTEKTNQILGGKITEGIVEAEALVEIYREGEYMDSGRLSRLQAGKQDVKSVEKGQECGLQYEGKPIIKEGDILHFYKEEKIYAKI